MENRKINSTQVLRELASANPHNKPVVYLSGVFNVIHPGHTRLFRFAASLNGFVVVGVTSDDSSVGAIVKETERLHALDAIELIDFTFIQTESSTTVVNTVKPAFVVKGREFEVQDNPELEALSRYGGRLLFSAGESSFSSLDLIRSEISQTHGNTITLYEEYLERHDIRKTDLVETLGNICKKRVLVVGDSILDEYVSCDAVGLSQEDPTVVVRPLKSDRYVGGAAIVAAHAAGLGAKVSYFSVVGQDEYSTFIGNKLDNYSVAHCLLIDDVRPTTTKKRFRAKGKTLLRVNDYIQQPISMELQQKLIDMIRDSISGIDLIILSDFSYGVLTQSVVDGIIGIANEFDVPVIADSQSSSQIGDISRFRNTTLITPTEHEARLAVKDSESSLVVLGEKLKSTTNAQHLVITLADEGVLIFSDEEEHGADAWRTDRVPAMNCAAKDPAGAGDAFMVTAGLCLASGTSIWQACYLASLAAAVQVGRVGNIPLSLSSLLSQIEHIGGES